MGDNLNGGITENRVVRTAAQTAVLMAILTLVSKILGFVREMVIAGFFGTSYIVDAYVMAQTIPEVIFGGIFASIGTAYLPSFSRISEEKGIEAGNRFTSQLINISTVFALLVIITGFFFSDQLVEIIARDFPEKTAETTSFYLKITFGYIAFTCSINMLEKYLQYRGSFLQPIIAGSFLNVGIIIGAIVAAYTSHYYLAVGFLAGYALRFLAVFVGAVKKGFKHTFDFAFDNETKQIVVLAAPVFLGSSISQLNTFVDRSLASSLKEGSVAALNYGWLLSSLITNLTATIITTILYPKITKAMNEDNWLYFNVAVEKALVIVLIIGIPFGMGAMAFSDEVVHIVYERGAFDANATVLTSGAFLFYAIGLPFRGVSMILTHVSYSMRNMTLPIKCSIASVIVNIALNFALIGVMEHKGLALATSIAAIVNSIFLGWTIKNRYPHIELFQSKRKIFKIVLISAFTVFIAALFYNYAITKFLSLGLASFVITVMIACVIYLTLLTLSKIDEVSIVFELIRRK